MKKLLKKAGKAILLFLLIVVVVNVLLPLFCKKSLDKIHFIGYNEV